MTQPDPEILTLTFESMAQGGEALAREQNGRVIFVPYAVAGETARVEIVESRRGFARGRLVELAKPSPFRVTPRCPHFPSAPTGLAPSGGEGQGHELWCGGCQLQHISYEAQLKFKTQIVRDQFARIAKMPQAPVLEILPAKNEWYYRNNMQFVVDENGALCLRAPDSHTLVPIRKCFIMNEPLGEMFKTLELDPASFNAVTLRGGEYTGEKFLILESDDPETPEIETDEAVSIAFRSGAVTVPILGKEYLSESIGDRIFRISPDSFFQVNSGMARILVDLAVHFLQPRAADVFLDAYGGGGLFGVTMAAQVARVVAIEENPNALDDARFNARDFENIEFHEGSVSRVLPKLDLAIDIAVVDPPRAGLEQAVVDALAAKHPRTIAYVSCDTATLARDVTRFAAHGYRLELVQPIDLFPQTHHVECVAKLTAGRGS